MTAMKQEHVEENESAFGAVSDGPVTARETVNAMVEAGLLDSVMARVADGDLQLTGEGGFLPEMLKAVLEAGLQFSHESRRVG